MNKITVTNFDFSYGNNKILENVNFTLNKNDFICLCGKNGSGKSTFLRYLSQYFSKNTIENAKQIAYMQQNEYPAWDSSVFNFILTGRFVWCNGRYSQKDYETVNKSAETLNIKKLLTQNINTLSGGEFQKVRIARALTQETPFLILDEPCANLDLIYETELLELLKNLSDEKNIGILISIHNVNAAARFAKKIAFIENRKIEIGSVNEMFTIENINNTFGNGIQIYNHPIFNCPQIC